MTTAPSAVGVDASGIVDFIDALESDRAIEPHGLIIQRHGTRIADGAWAPHESGRARLVYSLSKSFTGAALGLQIDEGLLHLDDLVSDHLPELFDTAHPDALRLRIRHIASMATGHDDETLGPAIAADPTDPVRGFLALPAQHEPGTVFAYNQSPVLALAAILERRSGQRLHDYLRPRLLEPLGISNFTWAPFPPGVDMGFSGVFTDLDAIAKLGQLHLDRGRTPTGPILSPTWVDIASSVHTNNPNGDTIDWRQGYGIQLWRSQHGYRGDGAFGQYMVVLPDHDAVVAVFSNSTDLQRVLDHMWACLLPAFDRPGSIDDDLALDDRLRTLRLPTACERLTGAASPVNVGDMHAQSAAPHSPTSHRSICSAEVRGGRLHLHDGDATLEVPLTESWSTEGAVAASAADLGSGTLHIDLVFLRTPHRLGVTLADNQVHSEWGELPLFGAGIESNLAAIAGH